MSLCPEEYPYAYTNGLRCCKSNIEGTSDDKTGETLTVIGNFVLKRIFPSPEACDGKDFKRSSSCCLDQEFQICARGDCQDCKWNLKLSFREHGAM